MQLTITYEFGEENQMADKLATIAFRKKRAFIDSEFSIAINKI